MGDEDDDRERVTTTTKDANPMWTAAPWAGVSATTTTTKRRAVSGHDDERIMMMMMRGKPTPRTGASRLGAVKEGETTTGDCTTTSPTTWGLPPRTRTSTVVNNDDDDDDDDAGLANAKATLSTEARSWKECFDRAEDVRIDGNGEITKGGVFRVYSSNFASSSGASDASDASPVLLACLHGCPYTGLTWGPCAEELARRARSTSSLSSPSPASSMEIFAMDLRGHGESVANAPDAAACESFDPDVMAEDALETLRVFVARRGEEEKTKKTRRKVVVVGHSMGGAIAARLAKRLEELDAAGDGFVEVVGLILIDIVEGSAMAALPAMGALVDARPETFESLEEAMTWSMTKGGGTRNPRSAAISLPSQLRELRVAGDADTSSASRRCRFAWRTNLRATAKYWSDWYTGLSKLYLSVKAPKLLLLAGNDRLDTELTIAQMQGKFQMTLLPKAGHAIQEDDPDSVATVLENFVGRYVLNPRPTPPSFFDADVNAKAPPG
jgi:protein phosphatase methylesterase 1